MAKRNIIKICGHAGILGPIIFSIFLFLAVINYPNYNPFSNYLSDLGVGINSSLFFNFGAVITGIFLIVFGYGLNNFFRRRAGFFGSIIFIIASLALIGIGLFTEESVLHYPFAAAFFVLATISLILIGVELRIMAKNYGYLSIVAGIIVLACALATMPPILEHISILAIGIAEIFVAIYVVRNSELNPKFIERLKKTKNQPTKNVKDFAKEFNLQ